MTAPLVQVENLRITAGTDDILVDGVSFTVDRGERMGLIGESGSGKTLTALSILGLLADGLQASGSIVFDGRSILDLSESEMCAVRGESISMIFQEPMTALNPVMRIGRQVAEPLRMHHGLSKSEASDRVVRLLDSVGIDQPENRARSFPHELSGGQRQRAMIAMALACGPDLVIADEPTTALDVTVQAQVLAVLRERVAEDAALILITHDLPVVASVTDSVVVLRSGAVVDRGRTQAVFGGDSDGYTKELVAAVPPMSRAIEVEAKPTDAEPGGEPIIKIRNVNKNYKLRRTSLTSPQPILKALDGVSLNVFAGETFGIVGESGSGKSTLARIIVGLNHVSSGHITVDGVNVSASSNLRPLRDIAQMVFQDPMGSLDPRMRIRDVVSEPLRSLKIGGDHEDRVRTLLDAVALPVESIDRYPHEFSGGERQRIAIARALAPGPKILVADEPVSALDMSVQTLTLDLLQSLKEQFDLTMVFISHDLSIVHEICERVVVLESGRIVEAGPVGTVFASPKADYTRALLAAIPRLDGSFRTDAVT